MPKGTVRVMSRIRGFLPVIASFLLGIALRGNDSLHIVLDLLYPPKDSVGSVNIEMVEIPSSNPLRERADLFLIRHESSGEEAVTLIRRGGATRVDHLLTGITERQGSALIPVGSLNPFSLLEMKLPPKTLAAATVMTALTTDKGSYSIATTKFEKKTAGAGDLIAMTANEMRNLRILYWLSMFTLLIVGLGVSRFTTLTHTDDAKSEPAPKAGSGKPRSERTRGRVKVAPR